MVPARVLATVSCTAPVSAFLTITLTGFSLLNQTKSAVTAAAIKTSVIKSLKRLASINLS
jgi:hypothetical protein